MVESSIGPRAALRELLKVRTALDVRSGLVVILRPSHRASTGRRQGAQPGRQPTM